jgi:outer membrane protein TolC
MDKDSRVGCLGNITALAIAILAWAAVRPAAAQEARQLILPEQRHFEIRDPGELPRARIPDMPPPATVVDAAARQATWRLSLDEAIRMALENVDVVRVVAGTTAVASGETIYGPAITNTTIDQSRAAFDPQLQSTNTFYRTEAPYGTLLSADPRRYGITANPVNGLNSTTSVSKQFITGGTVGVSAGANYMREEAGVLNPLTASNVTLSVEQPLLKGAGGQANLVPILLARINTERSYFQLKDSVQELVLGVIQTYWNLSYAQTEAWARRQQVQQGAEALERAEARLQAGLGDVGDVAQARVSYENFQAALVAAEANVLNQEALLRNLLGRPPSAPERITLTSAPSVKRLKTDWQEILRLAAEYRPDVVELKLVLEADQQSLLLSRNQALPKLNLGGLYRWNGLEGTTPDGQRLAAGGGHFTDWEAGVNFSVPLGLRQERAAVRERELLCMRDRANMEQALHSAAHALAASYRNLDQYYEQYARYRRMREAGQTNVERQMADYIAGRRTLYLNVLLAITDWGNAVNSEYQALVQYNIELARLERQTGTILETHGVRFVEERYGSIGPLGRFATERCYPRDMRPGPNSESVAVPEDQQYRRPAAPGMAEVDDAPAPEIVPRPAPRAGLR